MQKNKQLKLLILASFAMVFVAGCVTKPVVNQPISNQTTNDTEILEEVDTTNWLTYENTKYNFTLKYPKNGEVSAYPVPSINEVSSLSVSVDDVQKVYIDIFDPINISLKKEIGEEAFKIKTMPLEDYVQYIWELNNSGKNYISDIEEIEIDKNRGYRFFIEDVYKNETGGHQLSQRSMFIFIEHNGKRFQYEVKDDKLSESIIYTVKFVK